MSIELTRGQRRRMKKLAKCDAPLKRTPDSGGPSLKPAVVAPDDVARCLCFRPDKENCKCQRTKRKSIR